MTDIFARCSKKMYVQVCTKFMIHDYVKGLSWVACSISFMPDYVNHDYRACISSCCSLLSRTCISGFCNTDWCLFFCRLKINRDSHEFILESGTVANSTFKGSVHQKLRWVRNSTNRWLLAWDCGAWRFFVICVKSLHLVQNIFPIPVSTGKLKGDFWTNRWSAEKSFPCFLILSCRSCCVKSIDTAIEKIRWLFFRWTSPISRVKICSVKSIGVVHVTQKNRRNTEMYAPRFAYCNGNCLIITLYTLIGNGSRFSTRWQQIKYKYM
jgi:hypothetical protein